MVAHRVQITLNRRNVDFFAEDEWSSSPTPWSGFLMEEAIDRRRGDPRCSFPHTTLFLCIEGQSDSQWKHRGIAHTDHIKPGSLFLARRGTDIEESNVTSARRILALQMNDEIIRKFEAGRMERIETSLLSAVMTEDEWLAALMTAMKKEIKSGCPSGIMYGESLSLALIAYLGGRYVEKGQIAFQTTKLSGYKVSILRDYIEANISEDISIGKLASIVQMSPSHFSRSFKSYFGITPYQYVLRERVGRAVSLLTNSKLSSGYIAAELGFSSQSHFTMVFCRIVGCTPSRYRQIH